MTDYNYNDNRVTLGDDKSENSATALAGYPIDLRPDKNWPGLDRNPNEVRLKKQAMLDAAAAIDDLIRQVGNIDLSKARSTSFGPGDWEAAVYLQRASGQVAQAVSDYSAELIQNLQHASASIKAAAGNYAGAETGSSDSVNAVNNNLQSSTGGHPGTSATTDWGG